MLRRFNERALVALRLANDILGAGHRLDSSIYVIRYVQHGQEMPPPAQRERKVLVSNRREVHVVDGAKTELTTMRKACSVGYIVDLGAAARHVRRGVERLGTMES